MTAAPRTLEGCVQLAFDALPAHVQAAFATNPIQTLTGDLGLTVRSADHLTSRADGGSCDGMSFLDDGVILYATTGNRRENFTLAHELGHWLIDQTEVIYDWLAKQPEPAVALETLCDRIAQRLLILEDVITAVVGTEPVQARHVAELYAASLASWPVCAIALATRLRGLGAVIITNSEAVEYASIHPDPEHGWPTIHPWPGQPLPAGHPLQILKPGQSRRGRSFWSSWNRRETYYLDAIVDSRRSIAVLADTDLWNSEVFHPAVRREYRNQTERQVTCCGQTHTVRTYPCPTCEEPYCPTCGKCRCDRRAANENVCRGRCGLQYLPHLLENGLCEDCR